jgi:hypothetical protein
MTYGIYPAFAERGLATNSPDDVAISLVGLLAEKEMFGKGLYVEGGKSWELEDGIVKTMPQWLGEGPTKRLWEGLDFVSTVSFCLLSRICADGANSLQGEAWSFMKSKST